jgi:LPPG:FO 2-phospho-L-lactate transferase
VVVLAGGTGGAMLARGMADIVGPGQLTVIANTGDDIEIYGAHVSPDPDLITFWLADRINAQGWGLEGDSSHVMDALRRLGGEIWFNLGDEDLAIGIQRAAALRSGMRLTEVQALLAAHLAPLGQVLPMSDSPVRTRVLADGRWWPLQEFLIRAHGKQGEIEVEDVQFRGARVAGTTPEVLDALAQARVIVIGPSNPVISIGPMLAIGPLRDALSASAAPVVAVSPIVGGAVLKGPTAAFMRQRGVEPSAAGIANLYEGLIDGLVCDEEISTVSAREPAPHRLPTLRTNLQMEGPQGRLRLARETFQFALSLREHA